MRFMGQESPFVTLIIATHAAGRASAGKNSLVIIHVHGFFARRGGGVKKEKNPAVRGKLFGIKI